MLHEDKISTDLLDILKNHGSIDYDKFEIPPPVFLTMQGEFLSFSKKEGSLKCRFPVLKAHFNPYGVMQGGMISAAIDNTIGPLSMLVAPPSLTRKMEVKYSSAVEKELGFIYVTAHYRAQKKRFLYFEAVVENAMGTKQFASAKATHWIV